MKKTVSKIAVALAVALIAGTITVSAQSRMQESTDKFSENRFASNTGVRPAPPIPTEPGDGDDPTGSEPIGEGMSILLLLGASYAAAKSKRKRKE